MNETNPIESLTGLRKFKPYPAYKDSGVEWLGEIPAHWEVKRLKTIASVQLSNIDKKSVEGQQSVRLCNYVDVYYNNRITGDLDFMPATATPEQVGRFSLYAGDVLITKDSESWTDIAVPAVVAEDLPGVLCGYHLAHIRPYGECDGGFLSRVFGAIGPRDQFQIAANGITRFGLGGDAIRTGIFGVPPLTEQRAIAAFLDRETAKIDALVTKKERVIELLQEKRAALITRTVTKGLDLNVPMKDSGVEWLGEIPAHWDKKPAKAVCQRIIDCKNRTPNFDKDADYPVVRTTDVRDGKLNLARSLRTDEKNFRAWTLRGAPERDDILFTREAPAGEAALYDGSQPICLGQRIMYFRVDTEKLVPRFLLYSIYGSLVQGYILAESGGSTVTHLRLGQVYNLPLLIPPLPEQRAIVDYVDVTTRMMELTVTKVQEGIDRLHEYRTALISAAVTGKIDVREEAA